MLCNLAVQSGNLIALVDEVLKLIKSADSEKQSSSLSFLLKFIASLLKRTATITISQSKSETMTNTNKDIVMEDASTTATSKTQTQAIPQPNSLSLSLSEEDQETLNKRLCTFTTTGKNFSGQHWYYCYSCSLSFSEGCCSVCVQVCHAGHDVSYSRYSRFFCDCGAGAVRGFKCQCLVARLENKQTPLIFFFPLIFFVVFSISRKPGTKATVAPTAQPTKESAQPPASTKSLRNSSSAVLKSSNILAKSSSHAISKPSTSEGKKEKETTTTSTNPLSKSQSLAKIAASVVIGNGDDILGSAEISRLSLEQLVEKFKNVEFIDLMFALFQKLLQDSSFTNNTNSTTTPIASQDTEMSEASTTTTNSTASQSNNSDLALMTDKTVVAKTDMLAQNSRSYKQGSFQEAKLKFDGAEAKEMRQLHNSQILVRRPISLNSKSLLAVAESDSVRLLDISSLLQADGAKLSSSTGNVPQAFGAASPPPPPPPGGVAATAASTSDLKLKQVGDTIAVSFDVLNVEFNPLYENYLLMNGLKLCNVVTLNNRNQVEDQLEVQLSLEKSVSIIHCRWIPGSKTCISVLTTAWLKIYDLSKDAISPAIYLTLPDHVQTKDFCFIVSPKTNKPIAIIMMSTLGVLYSHPFDLDTMRGPIPLTTVLTVSAHLQGKTAGFLYYSISKDLLIVSYVDNKCFAARLAKEDSNFSAVIAAFPLYASNLRGFYGKKTN